MNRLKRKIGSEMERIDEKKVVNREIRRKI